MVSDMACSIHSNTSFRTYYVSISRLYFPSCGVDSQVPHDKMFFILSISSRQLLKKSQNLIGHFMRLYNFFSVLTIMFKVKVEKMIDL